MNDARTLYDKLWDEHLVRADANGSGLIYIDRHLLHEVTSPQAFEGLVLAGRKVWRIDANLAVPDHNVPTTDRSRIADPLARLQVQTLDANCSQHGIAEYTLADPRHGGVCVSGTRQNRSGPGLRHGRILSGGV